MKTIIVQRGGVNSKISDAVGRELDSIPHEVVHAEPEDYASHIRELGDDVGGFVFTEIDARAQSVIRLIRNRRRKGYPLLPVAILEDRMNTALLPAFGCACFNAANPGVGLGQFLSKPVEIRILLVEDEPGISEPLCDGLRPQFQVRAEMDGEAGLAAFQEARFDLAILDHRLPGELSGLDLLRIIKSSDTPIPVITMTAYDDDEREVNSYLGGADDYVAKPIYGVEEVRKTVWRVLNEHTLINRARDRGLNRARERWIGEMSAYVTHPHQDGQPAERF